MQRPSPKVALGKDHLYTTYSQLLENSQLTLMDERRGWNTISLSGLLLHTQPLHSSEQHTTASLEFSSHLELTVLKYILCKKATIDPRVVSTAPRGRRGSRSTPLGKMRSRSNDHYGIYVIPSLYHEGLGVTLSFWVWRSKVDHTCSFLPILSCGDFILLTFGFSLSM